MWNLHDGIVAVSAITTDAIPRFAKAPRIIPQVYAKNCKMYKNVM